MNEIEVTEDLLRTIESKSRGEHDPDGLRVPPSPAEVEALVAEIRRLRSDLGWMLQELTEYTTDADGTPKHFCEFVYNPPKGACDFHERFWRAWERSGLPWPDVVAGGAP